MLNIEQVRLLEERVQAVINRTGELQRENRELRERLESYQDRITELEGHIEQFVSSQAEIEQGVLNALHKLDEVEDAVSEGVQEDRTVEIQTEPDEQDEQDEQAVDYTGTVQDDGDAQDMDQETEEESEEQSGPELDIF